MIMDMPAIENMSPAVIKPMLSLIKEEIDAQNRELGNIKGGGK